jgi:hypothetical protein
MTFVRPCEAFENGAVPWYSHSAPHKILTIVLQQVIDYATRVVFRGETCTLSCAHVCLRILAHPERNINSPIYQRSSQVPLSTLPRRIRPSLAPLDLQDRPIPQVSSVTICSGPSYCQRNSTSAIATHSHGTPSTKNCVLRNANRWLMIVCLIDLSTRLSMAKRRCSILISN